MDEQNKSEEEKIINLRETLSDFVKEPLPEMSQEESIKAYRADDTIRSSKNKKNVTSEDDEDDENEDDEHLKRVKKELLDSLARVDALAKKIFDEKDKTKENLKNIKVNKAGGGKSKKEQEKILEQMRQKVEENAERSREE